MSNKQKIISKRLAKYDNGNKDNLERQSRLKNLVEQHTLEFVALAGGFKESTLIQYLRVKQAPAINENSVLQAERILKGL